MNFSSPKDIKYHVKRYIEKNASQYKDKVVVDLPAGTGISSELLHKAGAKVIPMDLFPDFFKAEGMTCQFANLAQRIPLDDNSADFILCQEGIEHMSDQMHTFKEFNRVLKPGGKLILTTPNYSSIKSKLSYLLNEGEHYSKMMPPNELDSVWMADSGKTDELYYGHIFLIGLQKLRVIGKLNGFSIHHIQHVRVNITSLLFLPFIYPLMWLSHQFIYHKSMKANPQIPKDRKKEVYNDQIKLNMSINTLVGSHIFVEFKKEMDSATVSTILKSRMQSFDELT